MIKFSPFWIFAVLLIFSSAERLFAHPAPADQTQLIHRLKIIESVFDISFLYEDEILENYRIAEEVIAPEKGVLWNIEKALAATDLMVIELGKNAYVIRKKETTNTKSNNKYT